MYSVEVETPNGWSTIMRETKGFCEGYVERAKESSPRLAMRVCRVSDKHPHQVTKIISEIEARDSVSIGMVAGWPTPEQYERAASEAIQKAEDIRAQRRAQESCRHSMSMYLSEETRQAGIDRALAEKYGN